MLQSISCPAGGEDCSEPPTSSGAQAVDSPQTALFDSPLSYLQEPVFSRQLRDVHPSLNASPPSIPNKRKAACVHIYQVGVQSSCQAENNTSGVLSVDAVSLELVWEQKP